MSKDVPLDEFVEGKKENREFVETAAGKIPSDWDIETVEKLCELRNGKATDHTEIGEHKYLVYGSNGPIGSYSDSNFDGGLIFGRVGAVGEVERVHEPVWVSDNAIQADVSDACNSDYLYYFLSNKDLSSLATKTAQPLLNQSTIGNVSVPSPPLSEQRKIATVLYTVDQAIEKTKKVIKQTHTVKNALLQDMIHGHHGDFNSYQSTPVGEIPSHWSVASIGDVVHTAQYGISESMSQEGQYPIFRMNNIKNGYMIEEPLKYIDLDEDEFEKYRVKKGDILFNRTNSLKLVGKTGIYDLEGDHVFASYLVRLQTNDRVNPYYLNYYMNSEEAQSRMMDFATKGVSQANINANSIQQVQLPLPPIDEQKSIVERIKTVDSQIEVNEEYKFQLKRLKQGLQENLLSGTVRTTDTTIEVPDEIAQHG